MTPSSNNPLVRVHPDQDSRRPNIYGGIENATISAGKRIGAVAREARDIPTAIGTVMSSGGESLKDKVQNYGKQVAEVGKTAITGKAQTSSDKIKEPSGAVKIVDPNANATTQKGASRQTISVSLPSPIRKTTSK